jgi:hypothetical protein
MVVCLFCFISLVKREGMVVCVSCFCFFIW